MRLPSFVFVMATGLAMMAKAETVTLTTLDWPPYTSDALNGQGAVASIVTEGFAAAGLKTDIQIVPWNRAIALAGADATVVAYFPGYSCDHSAGFVASNPVGSGPIALVERKATPITWQTVDDLVDQDLKFGVVKGYFNSAAFDAKVASGDLRVFPTKNDETNISQLLNGRVDAIVIDPRVMTYLVQEKPALWGGKQALAINPRMLGSTNFHVCFSDDPKGNEMRKRFDAAITGLDHDAAIETYIETEFQ